MKVSDLCAGYSAKPTLSDLSFSVKPGSIVGVVGPNGCGKSTLLKTLCGILPIQQGSVLYQGTDIHRFSTNLLARTVSYLPQHRNIPEIDVSAFVSYGRFPYLGFPRRLTKLDRQMVEIALHKTGVSDLAEKHLSQLSGGERQRVFLAQILAQDTPYILLDEPTTYMDIRYKLEFMELIHALQNKTILLVLHDLDLAISYCDSLLVLSDGKICGYGTPKEAIEKEWLKEAFGVKIEETVGYRFRLSY